MTSVFVEEHKDFVLKLKLKSEDGPSQVRRIRLPRLQDKTTGSVSYQELTGLIVSFTFPEHNDVDVPSSSSKPNVQISLTYRDVDQDIVSISSSEELVDAIEQYQNEKVLRIDAEIKRVTVAGGGGAAASTCSASVQATPERKDAASGTTSTGSAGSHHHDLPIGAVLDSFVGVLTSAVQALQDGMSEGQQATQRNVAQAASKAAAQAQRAAMRAARLSNKATAKAEKAASKVGQKAESAANKVAKAAEEAAAMAKKAALEASKVNPAMRNAPPDSNIKVAVVDGSTKSSDASVSEALDQAAATIASIPRKSVPAAKQDENKQPKKPFVHRRHTCDRCLATPIVGTRYHATNLPDYDLCGKCHAQYNGSEITFAAIDGEAPVSLDQFLHLSVAPRQVSVAPARTDIVPVRSSDAAMDRSEVKSPPKQDEKVGNARDNHSSSFLQNAEVAAPSLQTRRGLIVTDKNGNPIDPKTLIGSKDNGAAKKAAVAAVTKKREEDVSPEAPKGEESGKEERPFIHGRHTCDSCLTTPIVGNRYHAKNLPDYDLCEKCHNTYTGSEISFEKEELDRDRPKQDMWHARRNRFLETVVTAGPCARRGPFHGFLPHQRGSFGGRMFGGHPFGPGGRHHAGPYPLPPPPGHHGRHPHPFPPPPPPHGHHHHHHGPPPPPPPPPGPYPPPPPGPWGPHHHHHHRHHHHRHPGSEGWGDTFKVEENSWKCDVCLCRNSGDQDHCSACEMGRRPETHDDAPEMPLTAADFNKDLEEAIRQSLCDVVIKKAVESKATASAPTEEEIVVPPLVDSENPVDAEQPIPSAPSEEEIVVEAVEQAKEKGPVTSKPGKDPIVVETVENENDDEIEDETAEVAVAVEEIVATQENQLSTTVVHGFPMIPHVSELTVDNSFASDAVGSGDVAEAMGAMLDKVAGEISDMLAAESEQEKGATILDDTSAVNEEENSDGDDWHLVGDSENESENVPNDGDDVGRAAEMLGSALFSSDMISSGEAISTLSRSHGDWTVSSATSVPSTVPSLSAGSAAVASHASEDQRSRWAFQLTQLAELGFDDQDACIDILERLSAANIGVESDEEVDVGRVVNELLKKNESA